MSIFHETSKIGFREWKKSKELILASEVTLAVPCRNLLVIYIILSYPSERESVARVLREEKGVPG